MFRSLLLACLLSIASTASSWADDLVATKPGLVCVSADALARLTLSGGSSRTAQGNPAPADLALKQTGGCTDITIGMRVHVETARHNTSIVTYTGPDGQTVTAYVPNTDFRAASSSPAPEAGSPESDDTFSRSKIDQVIIAPGGATVYYILTLGSQDQFGEPDMEIQATYNNNASHVVLVKSAAGDKPEHTLEQFSNLFLSPDGRTLYFESEAWATSPAIHSVNIATKKQSFLVPGWIECMILQGEYQGDLVVGEHRSLVLGGTYDGSWLIDPTGKDLGMVSTDEIPAKDCPSLGVP